MITAVNRDRIGMMLLDALENRKVGIAKSINTGLKILVFCIGIEIDKYHGLL
jgi:hypothetical protein